jgi:hypothetical protein
MSRCSETRDRIMKPSEWSGETTSDCRLSENACNSNQRTASASQRHRLPPLLLFIHQPQTVTRQFRLLQYQLADHGAAQAWSLHMQLQIAADVEATGGFDTGPRNRGG